MACAFVARKTITTSLKLIFCSEFCQLCLMKSSLSAGVTIVLQGCPTPKVSSQCQYIAKQKGDKNY